MSHPALRADPIDCLFSTILGMMPPLSMAAVGGRTDVASTANQEPIEPGNTAAGAELGVLRRLAGCIATAIDSLRPPIRSGPSRLKALIANSAATHPNRRVHSASQQSSNHRCTLTEQANRLVGACSCGVVTRAF